MTAPTIIKLLMLHRGITQKTMAKMMGFSGQNAIAMKVKDGRNMGINSVIDMLDILGYEIVVRESTSGRRREDEIILTREDEEL